VKNYHDLSRRFQLVWLSAWPLWVLVLLVSMAALRILPVGYVRTALTTPILLIVPGSITLGAFFGHRYRPQGMIFICYAVLLSIAWSITASLILYVCGVLITFTSTYWCLLTCSAVLAVVAEARLLLDRPGKGRRIANQHEPIDPDRSHAEANDVDTPALAKTEVWFAILAIALGVSLLGGGLYIYDHSQHPTPAGYTRIAWAGSRIDGDIAVGPAGSKLSFEIVHHQSDTATFRLSAVWLGTPSRPLAKPLTFSIGPNQVFKGSLFVPPLPDGCPYRIVLSLAATRHINPLTKKPQIWSINADVHDPSKSLETCRL
jgi:hypothetical protein